MRHHALQQVHRGVGRGQLAGAGQQGFGGEHHGLVVAGTQHLRLGMTFPAAQQRVRVARDVGQGRQGFVQERAQPAHAEAHPEDMARPFQLAVEGAAHHAEDGGLAVLEHQVGVGVGQYPLHLGRLPRELPFDDPVMLDEGRQRLGRQIPGQPDAPPGGQRVDDALGLGSDRRKHGCRLRRVAFFQSGHRRWV